jgi:hypothetical protein
LIGHRETLLDQSEDLRADMERTMQQFGLLTGVREPASSSQNPLRTGYAHSTAGSLARQTADVFTLWGEISPPLRRLSDSPPTDVLLA